MLLQGVHRLYDGEHDNNDPYGYRAGDCPESPGIYPRDIRQMYTKIGLEESEREEDDSEGSEYQNRSNLNSGSFSLIHCHVLLFSSYISLFDS